MKINPAYLLGLALLAAGCDGDGMVNIPDPDPNTQAFLVEYRAESTFPSCDLNFRNSDGEMTTLDNQTMPFAISQTVQVAEDEPFEAIITADCSGTQFVGTSTVRVIVDNDQRDSQTATGSSFTITAAATLTAN